MRKFADTMTWANEGGGGFAIDAAVGERLGFIRKTYTHLLTMLVGVAAICALTVKLGIMERFAIPVLIGGVIGVLFVVPRLIMQRVSRSKQYVGAAICTLFYGMLLAPLVHVVYLKTGSYALLGNAFVLTSCVFVGLTAYVFMTKKDFSFLGGILSIGIWVAIGFALLSWFLPFGQTGGMIFSIAIVLLFAGYVLYDTSNIIRHYPVDAYVVAAIMLLINFVTMFYHIAILLLNASND